MNKRIWIVLLVITVLAGCKKYDDGPLMSMYSKGMRVNGTWYFERVTYDGKDSTVHYPYQQLHFYYIKDEDGGAFTWNHNIYKQMTEETYQTGIWKFIADRDSFRMVIFRNEFRDSTVSLWKINRLAYTEFWLEKTIKDNIKVDWHLIKYVY